MNHMQILNQLYAGKRIKIAFLNELERENFRQRMYKIKKQQDDAMSAVLDEEKLVLATRKIKHVTEQDGIESEPVYVLELWTEEKKAPSYIILSVEEGEKVSNDAGNIDASSSQRNEGPEKISGGLVASNGRASGDKNKDSNPILRTFLKGEEGY